MAKLYAELSSDKSTRVESKGGTDQITFKLYEGNNFILKVIYFREQHQLLVIDDTENLLIKIDGSAQIEYETA